MAVPNLWRTKRQRYSLQAEICPTCTQAIFPPREICPHCHQPTQAVSGGQSGGMGFGFVLLQPATQLANAVTAGDD